MSSDKLSKWRSDIVQSCFYLGPLVTSIDIHISKDSQLLPYHSFFMVAISSQSHLSVQLAHRWVLGPGCCELGLPQSIVVPNRGPPTRTKQTSNKVHQQCKNLDGGNLAIILAQFREETCPPPRFYQNICLAS